MADDSPTTLAFPAREPRPLVVPYVLTPGELAGLLRIGDARWRTYKPASRP